MNPTLEELLRMKVEVNDINERPILASPEFRVAVQGISAKGVHFIIHPNGYDGVALDLVAQGNNIKVWGE